MYQNEYRAENDRGKRGVYTNENSALLMASHALMSILMEATSSCDYGAGTS